ncbi:hypothetical protein BG023_112348 [Porphyrobacter sp. LM 6]|nr:hypothetical protein BG023_112348 [Porphyrobacter sp. LM 6]
MTMAGLLWAETLTAALLLYGGRLSQENSTKGLAAANFPAQFAIDWMRVYRCGSDPEKGRACMR